MPRGRGLRDGGGRDRRTPLRKLPESDWPGHRTRAGSGAARSRREGSGDPRPGTIGLPRGPRFQASLQGPGAGEDRSGCGSGAGPGGPADSPGVVGRREGIPVCQDPPRCASAPTLLHAFPLDSRVWCVRYSPSSWGRGLNWAAGGPGAVRRVPPGVRGDRRPDRRARRKSNFLSPNAAHAQKLPIGNSACQPPVLPMV
jgi:hypothetical protein